MDARICALEMLLEAWKQKFMKTRAYLSDESSECGKAMSQVSGALITAKRIYKDLQNSSQKIVPALCRKACLHMEEKINNNCMC